MIRKILYALAGAALLSLALSSCKSYDGLTDFAVPWQEGPEKVQYPIVGAQIQDKGVWVDGTVKGYGITFYLKEDQSDWGSLPIRFTLDDNIVSAELPSTVNLTKEYSFEVTDNFLPVNYTIVGIEYCPIDNITASIGSEACSGLPDANGNVTMLFTSQGIESAKLEITLKDGAKMVSPSEASTVQDLSKPLTIRVADDLRTYEYTIKATSMNVPSDWKNITDDLITQGAVIPSHIKICEKTNVGGTEGNRAVVALIPSGSVNLKTVTAERLDASGYFYPNQSLGDVVLSNSTYSLFVGGLSVGWFKPELLTGYVNDGQIVREPHADWNILYYTTPPVLGIKDGKAEISYAEFIDGKIYKYDTPQHGADKSTFTLGTEWDVDAAVSGYALPLQHGVSKFPSGNTTESEALWRAERYYSFSSVNDGVYVWRRKLIIDYWGNYLSCWYKSHWWDVSHYARTAFGVRENGDLIVFFAERYADENGYLLDAANYPSAGVTYKDVADELLALDCTDGMTLIFNELACGALQNGSTGLDLTKSLRTKDKDIENSTIIMFK